jgi:predicted component of type VI protein secretion system
VSERREISSGMSRPSGSVDSAPFLILRLVNGDAGSGAPMLFRFGAPGGLIGRGAGCDWVIDDGERILSKEHARIVFFNKKFCLSVLGRNGAVVNGTPCPARGDVPIELSTGDRLKFGRYEVVVEAISLMERATVHGDDESNTRGAPLLNAYPPVATGFSPPPLSDVVPTTAVVASEPDEAFPGLSEEWESKIGDLLRAASVGPDPGARPASPPPLAEPPLSPAAKPKTTLGALSELPPPTVVLPSQRPSAPLSAPPAGGRLMTSPDQGPLGMLLLGQTEIPPASAPSMPVQSIREREPAEVHTPVIAAPFDRPAYTPVSPPRPPPLSPSVARPITGAELPASFAEALLRGLGIGMPQVAGHEADAMGYDLGRALAALADHLVEVSHRPDGPVSEPFAYLPTGPLALSELVAAPGYLAGRAEGGVREAIAVARRRRQDDPTRQGATVEAALVRLEPGSLLARWNLDPGRRDTAGRAWALYEATYVEILDAARARAGASESIAPLTATSRLRGTR